MTDTIEAVGTEEQVAAWKETLADLAKRDGTTRWRLGDELLRGEKLIPNVESYTVAGFHVPGNDVYSEAQSVTHLSRQHLIDLASTARRCPSSVRTEALSWSHHRTIINEVNFREGQDEQAVIKEWLDKAVAGDWGVRDLGAEIKAANKAANQYTPAQLRKSFLVNVPIGAWETLRDIAGRGKFRQLAAKWILERAEQSQADRKAALDKKSKRLRSIRRKAGLKTQRVYGSRFSS